MTQPLVDWFVTIFFLSTLVVVINALRLLAYKE